jgi:ABC-2 type transport system permease protein
MTAAITTEVLKLRRSRLWWITLLASTLATLVGGMFMFISQNPDRARDLGLLGAKAQLATVATDWTGHFGLLGQIIAVGGVAIFGLLTVWVFGREFADHTIKDLLALPTSRTAIVSAKFTVIAGWCLLLTLYTFALGLLVGALLRLPGWSVGMAGTELLRLIATAAMTIGLTAVLALAASVGRGYLPAVGALILMVFCAQIFAALGYGLYFPWSVPALYSGLAGPDTPPVGPFSIASVVAVALIAVAATIAWWRHADQTH